MKYTVLVRDEFETPQQGVEFYRNVEAKSPGEALAKLAKWIPFPSDTTGMGYILEIIPEIPNLGPNDSRQTRLV